MASVSSLYSPSHHSSTDCYSSLSTYTSLHHVSIPNSNPIASVYPRTRRRRKSTVLCCNKPRDDFGEQPGFGTQRRGVLFKMGFTAFTFPAIVSDALANDVSEDFRVYTDDANKFQISIPQDWQVGAGDPSGFKSVTAFYPEETSDSNVSVVITGLGPDFTRMESFGKVEAFAETLVGGLDRSWQRPPGVTAKLIDCRSSNGIYYIEYTLQNPGESRKHLFSALGMAFNGWFNRLYTVTGQFVDEESEKYGSKIKKAVSSFKLI